MEIIRKQKKLSLQFDSDSDRRQILRLIQSTVNRAQRTMRALFLTFTVAWSVINGVNENEGKGKNRENLVSLLEF